LIRDDGGIGFLHWVGHGAERTRAGGGIHNLSCHGSIATGSTDQAALNWTLALNVIDGITFGRPVYCFIDACRRLDRSQNIYEGIGVSSLKNRQNAYVFASTLRLASAFWVINPTPAAKRAGFEGLALGTRAFMEAMAGFGARYDVGGSHMPIAPSELVEAARALVRRWSKHQGIKPGDPQGPGGAEPRSILLTQTPQSLVDVTYQGTPPQASCEAQPDGSTATEAPDNGPTPFEFRLARKRHKFRFDDKIWRDLKELFHPHMQL
jgi:hypothetical protein